MEKNKILPIVSILFAIIVIAVLAVWLISAQQKPEPEDIIEDKEEEFVSVEPIDEQAETDKEAKAPFPAEEIEDGAAFQEIILQLNTPQKLIDYLNKNFSFEEKESDQSMAPEEFFEAKKGNRADIATFSSFDLFKNGYYTTIFRYKFLDVEGKEGIRTLTLFAVNDQSSYIDLEGSKLKIFPAGNSFSEFFGLEEKRHNVKIIEYAAFTYGSTDLSKPDWFPR